jgi:anthranilate phosphoribosyltransferase
MQKGIDRATQAIDSGAATVLLSQWAALSQKLASS